MYEPDLAEFERVMSRLCAAFDTPLTQPRKDAYWQSFRKLQLREFERLVDAALTAEFAAMPNVGALWELHRKRSAVPQSMGQKGPTIQEQLCEYAAQHTHDLAVAGEVMTLNDYSLPWTHVYREWWDASRPKGLERCAECIGVVIECANGRKFGWSVAAMLADEEGHAKVMRYFQPQPGPNAAQSRAWHGAKAARDLTR